MSETTATVQWHDNWQDLPAAASTELASVGKERWCEAAQTADQSRYQQWFDAQSDVDRPLLDALFGNSGFLTRCATADPLYLLDILSEGPDRAFEATLSGLQSDGSMPDDGPGIGRLLRTSRRQAALSIAIADIAGIWSLEQVTDALSRFADQSLSCAIRHLLKAAADRGDLILPDASDPELGSGYIVLGMGKLGAFELNYSSDIDLIILFDPEVTQTEKPETLSQCFVKLTQSLVKLMSDRTEDGYVARLDLRLRPDPASTPVAMSSLAAETYYESIGQNWERAAMIKARAVAGDRAAGEAFLQRIRPFIWRKNLDFATIEDIHAIKRQIYAKQGSSGIEIPGHNIKLGRGGIREIEFFAQTQQLIWGGRIPELRNRATCTTLATLVENGQVTSAAFQELDAAYHYLRRLEHRLQMIDDQQTHSMPTDPDGLTAIAIFMGNRSSEELFETLQTHLEIVERHYADLFEDAPRPPAGHEIEGNLIFTGVEDDPGTLETLKGLGFESPKAISTTVRGWHHGRYAATRSDRARQLLTELMQVLLVAFGRTPNPDFAFGKFDSALSRLPFGIQLFSLFHANPELLTLVAEIMGSAPRMAEHLGQNPAVLESVLSVDLSAPLPTLEDLKSECREVLSRATDFEDALDIARRWANDHKFQIGIHILRHTSESAIAARGLSDIAEAVVSELVPHVEAEFASRFGRIKDGAMVVIGMGKLGGREMTPTSDLDLVMVYDHDPDARQSDGERALDVSTYYARLSQRVINAITALTPTGRLYEVDMRLRPSGNSGPIASTLEAFGRYHDNTAWTWEHMALTRARVIAGPAHLAGRVEQVISAALCRPRDPDALLRDVADMRVRIDNEHHSEFVWEVKYIRGGLVDIEFIVQYLQLRFAAENSDVLATNTADAIERLQAIGACSEETSAVLRSGHRLWQTVQAMLRLTLEGYFVPEREEEIPDALKHALLNATDQTDLQALKQAMNTTADAVVAVYHDRIQAPMAALDDQDRGSEQT